MRMYRYLIGPAMGNFMVSGSVDNTAIMWDVKKGMKPEAGLRNSIHIFVL